MEIEQPIYSTSHSRSLFQRINMAISVVVIVLGAFSIQGNPFLIFLGLGIGGLYWFTTPNQYFIYADKLIIHYGKPRIVEVPFDKIRDATMVKMPFSGVFIRRVGKSGVFSRPKNIEEFLDALWDAIQKNGGPAPEVLPPEDDAPKSD
jgi:hypothetical protein